MLAEPASVDDGAISEDEVAWHEAWRQRLSCWWLVLPGPLQADVGHCLGALSLHLSSRMDALLGRPGATGEIAAAEPGCEWLSESSEELQLPDFPSPVSFEFSLPPIPRLLPSREQLWLHSHADVHRDKPGLGSRAVLPLGIGTGILTFLFTTGTVILNSKTLRRASRRLKAGPPEGPPSRSCAA